MRKASRWIRGVTLAGALVVVGSPLSAQTWAGFMTGTQEVPPNVSTAEGVSVLSLIGHALTVQITWTGLLGGIPGAAHIHCCTAPGTNVGVAVGFPGFPATLAGTYNHTFDLTDPTVYTTAFRNNFGGGTAAGAEAALIAGLNAGQAYTNIHNGTWPGGEIRALLHSTPEPSSYALMATGLVTLGGLTLRRRRAS